MAAVPALELPCPVLAIPMVISEPFASARISSVPSTWLLVLGFLKLVTAIMLKLVFVL